MALDTEGRADEVEELKQDQAKKQKEGKGHWEDGLASDSESIVCYHNIFTLAGMEEDMLGYDANESDRSRPIGVNTELPRMTRSRNCKRRRQKLRARRTELLNRTDEVG
jgi:hypothetical protein